MIRRLVEAHYFQNARTSTPAGIRFWFQELRTTELLVELGRRHPAIVRRMISQRPLLSHVLAADKSKLEEALKAEEFAERERDRIYWMPLKKELEGLRHGRNP